MQHLFPTWPLQSCTLGPWCIHSYKQEKNKCSSAQNIQASLAHLLQCCVCFFYFSPATAERPGHYMSEPRDSFSSYTGALLPGYSISVLCPYRQDGDSNCSSQTQKTPLFYTCHGQLAGQETKHVALATLH